MPNKPSRGPVRPLVTAALATGCAMSIGVMTLADPPADPPPCDVTLPPVFCFRITDMEQDAADDNRIRFELEFVNWTATDAAGLVMTLNTGAEPGEPLPPGAPFIAAASIDADGRPLTGPPSPPAGNTVIGNDWTVLSQTATRVDFGQGGGTAMPHAFGCSGPIVDTCYYVPEVPVGGGGSCFDGLLDPDFATAIDTECISALLEMIPGSCFDQGGGGGPGFGKYGNVIQIPDPETIDDGPNVLDGFVIEIDDLDPGDQVSLNWHLIDGAGNAIGIVSRGMGVQGDQYGFGVVNLAGIQSPPPAGTPFGVGGNPAPPPLFNGNTGYDPPSDFDPDLDDPMFWAEDQDVFSGVDQFPVNPLRPGEPGEGKYFAVELGAAVTAEFTNPSDNQFQFDGMPIVSGVNFAPQAINCAADVVGDGVVDVMDLNEVINNWGLCPTDCAADVNNDGAVDVNDLILVITNWGPCSLAPPVPCIDATGDCFVANPTPGCENEDCCALVCARDPICCDTQWDGLCADAAIDICP